MRLVGLREVVSVLTCRRMKKIKAIELLGGTLASVAAEIGITASAVSQWPEELPKRIEDRVLAALARKHLAPHLLGQPAPLEPVNAS